MAEHSNYVRRMLEVMAANPERPVMWWRGEPVTAEGVTDAVTTAARSLFRLGDQARIVGVLTVTNSPDTLILRYAVNLAGATVVHLQTTNAVDPGNRMAVDDVLDLLVKAGVSVLAVDEDNAEVGRQLRDRLAGPLRLVALRPLGDDVLDLSTGGSAQLPVDVDPDAVAAVTHTSGTTGRPKGIAVTFRSRSEIVDAAAAAGATDTVYLSALPISHSSGGLLDGTLASGGAVVLHETFDPGEVLRTIALRRVNHLFVSPPQLYRLLDHEDLAGTDRSSLGMLVYAGCAAAPARLAEAVTKLGPVLYQIYGTAEAGMISMLAAVDHVDPELRTTVGRPVGEVRIRDEHDGHDLPVGEIGEICARTSFTMQGYWRDPELTARVVRDGWVHTGDLGRLDERGYLRIHGRMGEMIKTKGIKVYPATVEHALLGHPQVAQAAVFGVSDADRVEHIHAAVVLRRDATATAGDLRAHVTAELSVEHAPVVVDLLAALPLSANGKPDKLRLVAAATAGV
ncbi:AMP-binding protein [Dactylosporangium sp. NPDC051484]|uniref:AMP-binding protein n=1 Tax=Dactylosporangium sp. NPDC051484 TaxID=3154942 RepID=UPI0034510290